MGSGSGLKAATLKGMSYQTRVDSEDDWELVVLNLVRRPSGIAEDYAIRGGSRTGPGLGREGYLYARGIVPG